MVEISTTTCGRRLTTSALLVGSLISLGGLFIGFDQGQTTNVFALASFRGDFCVDFGKNTVAACDARQQDPPPDNWLAFTATYALVFHIGGIIGAFVASLMAERLGRRPAIVIGSAVAGVGALGAALVPSAGHVVLLSTRAIQGLGVGAISAAVPIYSVEIASAGKRGFVSGLMQVAWAIGLLVGYVSSLAVNHYNGSWRVSIAASAFLSVGAAINACLVTESPRWLYHHQDREAAEGALTRLRQDPDDVDSDLQVFDRCLNEYSRRQSNVATWAALFETVSIRPRLVIAIFIQVLQPATGVSSILLNGENVFHNITRSQTPVLVVMLLIVNFAGSFSVIRWLDPCGRRLLLLVGAVGMCIGYSVAAIATLTRSAKSSEFSDHGCASSSCAMITIAAMVCVIFHFSISWRPLSHIYSAEIFSLRHRSRAFALSTAASWVAQMLLALVFPRMVEGLSTPGTFAVLAGCCAAGGGFVFWSCPETNTDVLEDVEDVFAVSGRADGESTDAKDPRGDFAMIQTPTALV